jgi:hypothetical protein
LRRIPEANSKALFAFEETQSDAIASSRYAWQSEIQAPERPGRVHLAIIKTKARLRRESWRAVLAQALTAPAKDEKGRAR